MTTYEYTGVVEEIGETKSFGANGFTKRDMVVGNDVDSMSRYPNPVLFTFKKERTGLCDAVKKGDRVKVTFTIDGRRWEGPQGVRYFTDLTGWKVETLNADGSSVAAVAAPAAPAAAPEAAAMAQDDPDSLPF